MLSATSTGFSAQLFFALKGLVPSDYCVYSQVDMPAGKATGLSEPPVETLLPGYAEIFNRHVHEHPVIGAHQSYGGALKISDLLSQRQFRRLALYNEVFKPFGVRYEMSLTLPDKPGLVMGLVLARRGLDFSEKERLLLDLVRPNLVQARHNAEILDLTRRGLELGGNEIVYLDAGRRITYFSGGVASLMPAYFDGPISRDKRLPEDLDHWVREQQGRFHEASDDFSIMRPLVVDGGDRRLVVRFLYGGGGGQEDMLLLHEQQIYVSPESLGAIGLTPREAEVLGLVIRGKSVAEISGLLVVSGGTVEKHLEHIYAKLGVHSRASAVAAGLRALK